MDDKEPIAVETDTETKPAKRQQKTEAPAIVKTRKPRVTQRSITELWELPAAKMTEAEKGTMINRLRDTVTGNKNIIDELRKQIDTMYKMKCNAEDAYNDIYRTAMDNQRLMQDNVEMLYRNSRMLKPLARLHNGTLNDDGGVR